MDTQLFFEHQLDNAKRHIKVHNCSAHPYPYWQNLQNWVVQIKPRSILEIGTGAGFSGLVMQKSTRCDFVSIELDKVHIKVSRQLWLYNSLEEKKFKILHGKAEEILPSIKNTFDFIFFDGFGIHYEFLAHYYRLLNLGGICFIANNHLKSKTSAKFFAELQDPRLWQIVSEFEDTTVAKKITLN